MSWLFSQALVEEYSEGTSLAGAPCAELNVMPSPQPFWRNDKTIDASRLSRFGPTCRVLTAFDGEAVLTSYLAAFPVKISALPEKETGSTAHAPGSGLQCGVSLARLDPGTSSLRTHQRSLLEEGFESLETLPPWGMIAAGELYQQPTPSGLLELRASITSESGYGFPERVPTAIAGDAKSSGSRNLEGSKAHAGVSLTDYVKAGNSTTPRVPRVLTPTANEDAAGRPGSNMQKMLGNSEFVRGDLTGGTLNPTWVEWLMGWPIGWTDLNAPATARFRQWCASHGKF